jgi:glycyl-tRNA synthetase beta chain
MPDFLLEIGCEEIPARMLHQAESELARRVLELVVRESLFVPSVSEVASVFFDPEFVEQFSTPRRLAVLVHHVADRQLDVTEELLGPSVKVAFENGVPTAVAGAFAKKVGLDLSRLKRVSTPKGEYVAAMVTRKGRNAADVLAQALPKEIAAIYWAKNMYWRASKPERFVRPIHWIVALIDDRIVPLEFAGIRAGRKSRGHRILGPGLVEIKSAKSYEDTLVGAKVNADYSDRHYEIAGMLSQTPARAGASAREDGELLDTVTNLVEWPSVILGTFDRQFLSLPEEVLVTVMRDHQKYFAVEDASGKLAPHFLAVLNTDGDPDGLIRHGNERVLRARFTDAQFFWDSDNSRPFPERREMLRMVTFQRDLGSYYEKTERMVSQAKKLARSLRTAGFEIDPDAATEAARLAKNDLTTELVKEFTELQGVIGGLYAGHQGLPTSVAVAIYDQYKPESMDDTVPRTLEGAVLSIVDKADTIAGMFAMDQIPSGSSDPFALRRQANGIVKTIAEKSLSMSLSSLFAAAVGAYKRLYDSNFKVAVDYASLKRDFRAAFGARDQSATLDGENAEHYPQRIVSAVASFFRERAQFYLKEIRGLRYDIVNAAMAVGYDDIPDLLLRARATAEIANSDYLEPISIAFKRMKNILRQARERKYLIESEDLVDNLRSKEAEKLLSAADSIGTRFRRLRKSKRYVDALALMSTLRCPIDDFFESVMVMVDDNVVRAHRLGLIQEFVRNFSTIADFSEIVTESR